MGKNVLLEKQILFVCPQLKDEWDYDLNEIKPEYYSYGSGKKVYWRCKRCGHIWTAKIFHRKNGSGCPRCAHGKRTSLPEQVIYYYLRQYFPDAQNGYKPDWMHRMSEIDIYIPSINLGIEYDGGNWHKHIDKDIEKSQLIISHGIGLIRIRDKKCKTIDDGSVHIDLSEEDAECLFLKPALDELFAYIINTYHVDIELDINIERDFLKIIALYAGNIQKNSLAEKFPEIAREWDYESNGGLLPEQISYGSKIPVTWKCADPRCNHSWKSAVKNRTIGGSNCPECAKASTQRKRQIAFLRDGKNTLATKHPHLVPEWDYDRNIDYVPEEVNVGKNKKFIWNCENNHLYSATISDRLRGRNCPFCAGRKVWIGFNDIGTKAPGLLKEWDYEANGEITPYTYTIGSHKKVSWKCSVCGNCYLKEIRLRVKGHGCSECSKKAIGEKNRINALKNGENSLANKRPDLLKDWDYEKNTEVTPYDISVGSDIKVFWKCHKCGYQWDTKAYVRGCSSNHGCGACSNRVLWEGHNDLKAKHPDIALEWDEDRNGVSSSKVFPGNKNPAFWWKCRVCGTNWQAPIRERVKDRKKCPHCYPKKSK